MDSYETIYKRYRADLSVMEEDARNDLTIDRDDVLLNMLHQAELCFKWGRITALAQSEYEQTKRAYSASGWNAAKYAAREALSAAGEKITESRLDEEAWRNTGYQAIAKRLSEIELIYETLKKAESAMWQRKDMLQSLNSRQRAELETR